MNISQWNSLDSYPQKLFKQTEAVIHQTYAPSKYHSFECQNLTLAMRKLECLAMPAKFKSREPKPQYQTEFVNIALTKKDKETFKTWYDAIIADLPDMATKFIAEGYKISFRWDNDNECFICSATCIDESHENNKKTLTSRSDQWLEALALNMFKTYQMCKDGVWESTETGYNWG